MDLVLNYLKNELELTINDYVVVGVSAGPDSMCLLHLLIELKKIIGFHIVVAHINHKVRIESDEEQIFLKEYFDNYNLIFECREIKDYPKENFHVYARNFRYKFYKDLVHKYKAKYLMTAHHGDDLIETVLMRLTRGSTFAGYHGISLKNKLDDFVIVRPMLFVTKNEIKEYNDQNNIPYRIDKSNDSDKYTRNRFRKEVLPFLKKENSSVHLKFLKYSSMIDEINNYLSKEVDSFYKKMYVNKSVIISDFLKLDEIMQRFFLERVFQDLYFDLSYITDKNLDLLLDFIKKQKTGSILTLPLEYEAVIDYNQVIFRKKESKEYEYIYELKDGLVLDNGMKFVKLTSSENGNDTLHVWSEDIKLPLYVRNKKIGDFIELKGMPGKKKVSDIFIDSKLSKEIRKEYPVVVDSDDKIIWIPKLKKSKYDGKNIEKYDIIFKCL